jgi:hypothetical protein
VEIPDVSRSADRQDLCMPSFSVEQYLPGSTAAERGAHMERVHAARERLAGHGARLRTSLIVPADEMCMHVFDADSEADLIVAYRRTRLPYDRIVEVELRASGEQWTPPPGYAMHDNRG